MLVACVIIFVIALLLARWMKATSTRDQFRVGAFWVALTLVFEFALGRAMGIELAAHSFGLQSRARRFHAGRARVHVLDPMAHEKNPMITHSGGCHCGRVRFEVDAPAELSIDDCNCSMCSRTGYLHLIVTADRFRITKGEDALTTYTFNTGTARHLFCATLRHQAVLCAALASGRIQRERALHRFADRHAA